MTGQVTRKKICERDGWQCHYCGKDLRSRNQKSNRTMDHVVPKIRLGPNGLRNMVLACERCNRRKSSKSYVTFCKEIGREPAPWVLDMIDAIVCEVRELPPLEANASGSCALGHS